MVKMNILAIVLIVSNRLIVSNIVHWLVFDDYHSNMYWDEKFHYIVSWLFSSKTDHNQFRLLLYVTFVIDWMSGLLPDLAWSTDGLSTGWITDRSVWVICELKIKKKKTYIILFKSTLYYHNFFFKCLQYQGICQTCFIDRNIIEDRLIGCWFFFFSFFIREFDMSYC